jgi:uncharacterized protein with HEPN domain
MKADFIYLRHILDAIGKIERYLAGTDFEAFSDNDMMIDAVVRELEIIGEAARNLKVIWDTYQHNLPPFKAFVEEVLEGAGREGDVGR